MCPDNARAFLTYIYKVNGKQDLLNSYSDKRFIPHQKLFTL